MKYLVLISTFVFFIIAITTCSNPTKELMRDVYGKNFKPPQSYVYIPSGNLLISKEEKISIQGFFISECEISNQQYSDFLNDLLKQGRKEDHKIANRQPEKWRVQSFTETYHRHPAYAEYPVLTIPKSGAELYCQWMNEKLKTKYPNLKINFRLPTEEEWMYAAKGGHDFSPYPWGDYYLRNPNGTIRANFKGIGASRVHYDRKNGKYELKGSWTDSKDVTMTAPVKSFLPNNYGLYHMSGNVAEMLSDNSPNGGYRTKGGCYTSGGWDIRIDAEDEFEGWKEPSPFIGFRPVFSLSVND